MCADYFLENVVDAAHVTHQFQAVEGIGFFPGEEDDVDRPINEQGLRHLCFAGRGDVGDVEGTQDFADQPAREIVRVNYQDGQCPRLQRPGLPGIVHSTGPPNS